MGMFIALFGHRWEMNRHDMIREKKRKAVSSIRTIKWISALLLATVLSACGGSEPIDPEAVEIELTTESPAVANEETKLIATLTGAHFPADATAVNFDIRIDLVPRLINGQAEGDNTFAAWFTFPEPGTYDVYLHVYIEDLHLMELKKVEVQ